MCNVVNLLQSVCYGEIWLIKQCEYGRVIDLQNNKTNKQ